MIESNILDTLNVTISPIEKFLEPSEKNNPPKTAVLGPLTEPISASLFVKSENFSFSADEILQKCRMTISMLPNDSFESGEHSTCLQSMCEVCKKYFQTHF